MVNLDFAALAGVAGITGFPVHSSEILQDTLAAVLAHPGPMLVDTKVTGGEVATRRVMQWSRPRNG